MTGPSVVAVGGGHGLAATLRAVRTYTDQVTAIVSVADDGGSSGRLRQTRDIIAPGDLRKCLVALAEPGSALAEAFAYRFAGDELDGHSLGNLILAGLFDSCDTPVQALDEACRLLGVRGRVLPASIEPIVLKADAECGEVDGQVTVMGTGNIRTVSLVPADPPAPEEAIAVLQEADQILLGPGSLFTSVLAAAAVPAITDAINRARARTIYICNLRPQIPETEGFDIEMHVAALVTHGISVDLVVADTSTLAVGTLQVPLVRASLTTPSGLAHEPSLLGPVLARFTG